MNYGDLGDLVWRPAANLRLYYKMDNIYLLKLLSFHLIYRYTNNDMHIFIQAGPDAQFYVKYRIRETTCATEENKLWQDCAYKVSAEAVSICSFQKFSVQKQQHNDQDCSCLGKNTAENLAFFSCVAFERIKVQYKNVYNIKVNHHKMSLPL